jgi:hypothetical protein
VAAVPARRAYREKREDERSRELMEPQHQPQQRRLVRPRSRSLNPASSTRCLELTLFFPFSTSAFSRSRSRVFMEKRMAQEVSADSLGDEWKGYVFRITGGNDKQGELRIPALDKIGDPVYPES